MAGVIQHLFQEEIRIFMEQVEMQELAEEKIPISNLIHMECVVIPALIPTEQTHPQVVEQRL